MSSVALCEWLKARVRKQLEERKIEYALWRGGIVTKNISPPEGKAPTTRSSLFLELPSCSPGPCSFGLKAAITCLDDVSMVCLGPIFHSPWPRQNSSVPTTPSFFYLFSSWQDIIVTIAHCPKPRSKSWFLLLPHFYAVHEYAWQVPQSAPNGSLLPHKLPASPYTIWWSLNILPLLLPHHRQGDWSLRI